MQVLGKFGFSQSNLMINPQIDTMNDLPPIPALPALNRNWTVNNIPESSKQTAESFVQYEALTGRNRKRRGRPKRFHRNRFGNNMEFTDDPELSLELEKFALKFNLNQN